MIVELTTAGLPWRRLDNMKDLCKEKTRVHSGEQTILGELFAGCPIEYKSTFHSFLQIIFPFILVILQYVITLSYYDTPNYQTVSFKSAYKQQNNSILVLQTSQSSDD